MTVTRVFAFRACTNAARNGAPSGPVTLPVIVAPNVIEERRPTALTKPSVLIILSGCIAPPCNQRSTPLNPRTSALKIGREIYAKENGLHRIILQFCSYQAALPQRLAKKRIDCLWRFAAALFLAAGVRNIV